MSSQVVRPEADVQEISIGVDELDGESKQVEAFSPLTPKSSIHFSKGKRKPVHVRFCHVNYVVQVGKDDSVTKDILKDISGEFQPGEMVAIMGASGSGKTSLLNVLARRTACSSGSILYNRETNIPARAIAYVQQDDLHLMTLTVSEVLRTHALLRLDKEMSKADKLARVDAVIQELGLSKVKNSVVGNPALFRGISGGEMRRLSFGAELLTDPSIIFADEPTSGLDAFMAEQVVQTLKALARAGRTVVCTIHQPSSTVYELFDRVIYLANGEVAYNGARKNAIDYFGARGFQCPVYQNPADFFIKVLSIMPSDEEASNTRIDGLLKEYKSSSECTDMVQRLEEYASNMTAAEGPGAHTEDLHAPVLTKAEFRKANWFTQYTVLLKRAFSGLCRDKMATRVKAAQTLVMGLLVGLIYLQLGNDQQSIQDKNGALFFTVSNTAFGGLFSVIQVFPLEIMVFKREYQRGMYSVSSYFLSKTMSEIPFAILFPVVFCCIEYWMVGFRADAGKFFTFMATIVMSSNTAMSLGYVVSAAAPTVQAALAMGPVMFLPFIFGGFFVNNESVPDYFVWLEGLSLWKYAFQALAINEWTGATISCTTAEIDEGICFSTGEQVLERLSLDTESIGFGLGMLAVLMVGFRLLAFLFLYLRARSALKGIRVAKKQA